MYSRVAFIVLAAGILCGSPIGFARPVPAVPAGSQQQKRLKQQKADAKQTSLTGCVDEQDGQYLLAGVQNRDLIAHLEAEGFPTEGFAKHLGHEVTVRGTLSSGGTPPIFKVRSVATVRESCGPQR
jgi:hypothetical protein